MKNKLSDLIAALQIFLKYGDVKYPTCCEHDALHVHLDPSLVSAEDATALEELGFIPEDEGFRSYRFGSA